MRSPWAGMGAKRQGLAESFLSAPGHEGRKTDIPPIKRVGSYRPNSAVRPLR